ncbi:MAG: hypothetical protein JF614_08010 [Acidobacteria bacterium]|nr:hypothetical protein [Acidobacteriota bacterium]
MKRLLLVLLVSATAIMAAGQPPTLSADCLYERIFYYQTPDGPAGGPACGRTDIYCNDAFHYGCQTQYYRIYTGQCICP